MSVKQSEHFYETVFDAEQKQWVGTKYISVFDPESSLANAILTTLQANGSRIAQICAKTNTGTTFIELHTQTVNVAKHLKKIGCQKDDVIFILSTDASKLASLTFAAICLGCPITDLPTCWSKGELTYFLSFIKPKYVFCDAKFYDMLKENQKNAKFFVFGEQTTDAISADSLFDSIDPDDSFTPTKVDSTKTVAIIARSSGTTGMPKGVRVSHANILDDVNRLSPVLKSNDVVLGYTTLFAITGVITLLNSTLSGATRIVNAGPFSPERFLELVKEYKVSFMISTTFTIHQLLNHPSIQNADLSSFRYYLCAGTKVPHDIILKMNECLVNGKFCDTYGMTELCGLASTNLEHINNDCVGQLAGGCTAKIVNEQGQRLGIGETGDLHLKMRTPFLGYISASGGIHDYLDSEGFYITGDVACFDANGDLFIVSRKKELFKSCGLQVTPLEIEEFLNGIDGVERSVVVPIPDSKTDFLPAAVIQKSENSTCTEESICKAVADNFAHYKQLKGGVFFVESLPVTATDKIARNAVTQTAIDLFNKRTNQII